MVITLVLRNGQVVQFETNRFSVKTDKNGDPIIETAKKDNGLSLMFARPSQIDAIIRDTSRPEVEAEAEAAYDDEQLEDAES